MRKVIPCFYGSYGKYLVKLRSIPSYDDGLIPATRRILLSLHDVAKEKLTKSNVIVGHAMGSYHPHGDLSIYSTLQKLVLHGFASSEQSNWGSRSLHGADEPAAMRYTETKLEKWVEDLAFKYYKYSDWDNIEHEDEPLFLPCPVPVGLIGYDVITGIAFHRVSCPRYTIKDLLTRLKWLLDNGPIKEYDIEKIDEENIQNTLGPEIKPNFRDCISKPTEKDSYYRILTNGEGSLKIIPNGGIGQDKSIYIKGQVPGSSFKRLKKLCDPNNKNRKFNADLIDLCGTDGNFYSIIIQVVPTKKNQDLKSLFKEIWSECLISNINFECYFSDDEGKVLKQGIDDIIIRNYNNWVKCVFRKRAADFDKINKEKFNLHIIDVIRKAVNDNGKSITSISNIINYFQNQYINKLVELEKFDLESSEFKKFKIEIDEKNIERVCKEKSISKLIEIDVDFVEIDKKISDVKNHVKNTKKDCYDYVVELLSKES